MKLDFAKLHEYLQRVSPASPPILAEMEKVAKKEDFPIIGRLVGRFLYQLVKLTSAKRIFELGSGFGYSALWFALALPPGGKVYCTDGEQENKRRAQDYFKRAGQTRKLRFMTGDGVKLLKQEKGKFDIILNDIDKENYPQVVKPVLLKLKTGGVLVSDNMFFLGTIFDNPKNNTSSGILNYTRMIYRTPQLFSTILPIRDGISVSVKL